MRPRAAFVAALLGFAAGAFVHAPVTKAMPAPAVARWDRRSRFFGFGGAGKGHRTPRCRNHETMAQQQRRATRRRNRLKHKARTRHSRRAA